MGFPIRSWSDILRDKERIEANGRPSYYTFLLYKSNHTNFRDYILDNFNRLHDMSVDVVFFVLDKPEEWLKRDDIGYYRTVYDQNYTPELNDAEVDIVCEYFGIHTSLLPTVIAFPNLDSKSCNIFGLKGITDFYKLDRFFGTLLTDRYIHYTTGQNRFGMNKLIKVSSIIRREFPEIRSSIAYLDENNTVENKLNQIAEAIDKLHYDMREGFNTVLSKLEQIQEDIKPFKETITCKFEELNKLPDSLMKEKELEELHSIVDKKLLNMSNQIIEDASIDEFCSLAHYEYLECFEEESVNMIRSCFITDHLVTKKHLDSFDYSLCSVGFWKAMEIELNIILIDSIRILRNFIDNIPSRGIPLKSGKCDVFAGYRDKNQTKIYLIDINKQRDSKLISLMFGELIKISENYENNDLKQVLEKLENEIIAICDVNIFMSEFIESLTMVVREYRNRCSHTGLMKKDEYNDLKDIIFSKNGLYEKIAVLKGNLGLLINENDSNT